VEVNNLIDKTRKNGYPINLGDGLDWKKVDSKDKDRFISQVLA
jgi:hypothetical protein